MSFQYPQTISLAQRPTPIQKMVRLTEAWDGPEIYMKRDDLTGCLLSGNKVRKLEFSVAEASSQGADTLITCGGIQSNHARATAVVAARLGLKSLLVLRGQERGAPDGNLFLDRLVGATFRFITQEDYKQVDAIMAEAAGEVKERGGTPYIIPEGASNEIGYFGYIRAAQEINEQMREQGLHFDYMVTATGSGGTLGGLVLGREIFHLAPEPLGINVCDTAAFFKNKIHSVFSKMRSRFGWDLTVAKEEIRLIDGYVGRGYALSRPEELELIREVAALEGIVLDPVYTGKAMFGLKDQIRKGFFKPKDKVLFLHTGGIFGLFPVREALATV